MSSRDWDEHELPTPVKLLVERCKQAGLLTEEQERQSGRLGIRKSEGDRLKLMQHNGLLMISEACKLREQFERPDYPFEDMVGEGIRGLATAAAKYDSRRGCRFSTMACWWIQQAIKRGIVSYEGMIRIPDRFHPSQGYRPSELDDNPWSRFGAVYSLDQPIDEDSNESLGDSLADDADPISDAMSRIDLPDLLRRALARLTDYSPFQAEVICAYFGIGMPERSSKDLSRERQCTVGHINIQKNRGLRYLRQILQELEHTGQFSRA